MDTAHAQARGLVESTALLDCPLPNGVHLMRATDKLTDKLPMQTEPRHSTGGCWPPTVGLTGAGLRLSEQLLASNSWPPSGWPPQLLLGSRSAFQSGSGIPLHDLQLRLFLSRSRLPPARSAPICCTSRSVAVTKPRDGEAGRQHACHSHATASEMRGGQEAATPTPHHPPHTSHPHHPTHNHPTHTHPTHTPTAQPAQA